MNKLATILLTLAALSVALPPSLAAHCAQSSTSETAVKVGKFYIMVDTCVPDCLSTVVIYEESNLRDGLQRWDGAVDNTCHRKITPDMRIL